jgi:plasmid maintenance system antidote protein VapI
MKTMTPSYKMKDPPHVGRLIRSELLDHFGVTIEAAFGIDAALLTGMQHVYALAQSEKRRPELTRGIQRVAAPVWA